MNTTHPAYQSGQLGLSRNAHRVLLLLFRLGAVIVVAATFMLTPERTLGHAAFESSDPVANSVVENSPTEVSIRFTEPLEDTYTGASLLNQNGDEVPDTSFRIDEADQHRLILALPPSLPNGTYTVSWQNLSAADGHRLQGYFAFTVGTAADVGAIASVSVDEGIPFWLGGVARWLALLGIALVASLLPIWLFVIRPVPAIDSEHLVLLAERIRRLAIWGVAGAAIVNLFALIVQTKGNAGDESIWSVLSNTTFDTRYGRFWLVRIGLLVVLAAVFWLMSWSRDSYRRPIPLIGLAASLALPIPVSMLAHASAQVEHRSTAIAFDYVHLLAAAIWGGGLAVLTYVLLPPIVQGPAGVSRRVLAGVIPRFSVLGLAAWVTLALSGIYMAYLQVGSWGGLWHTAYGDSLVLKLVALSPALLLAAANLLVQSPRLRSSDVRAAVSGKRIRWAVAGELIFVLIVLFFVGRLVGQEPAREVIAARNPVGIELNVPLVTQAVNRPSELSVSPGRPGPNSYHLEVGGNVLPDGTDGVLRVNPSDDSIGQKEIKLTRTEGTNTYTGSGSELALPGEWSLEVIVRKPGTLEGRSTLPITLDSAPPGRPERSFWLIDWPGLVGLAFVVFGVATVAIAWLVRASTWRPQGAIAGGLGISVGALLIYGAMISPPDAESRNEAARPGTPVATEGIEVALASNFGVLGESSLTISVADESGAPIDDAEVSIDGVMPAMGMTLASKAATPLGAGQYQVDAVPITMSGDWHIDVTVDRDGAEPITVPFVVPVGG